MIITIAALLIAGQSTKHKLLVVDTLIIGQNVAGKWKMPPAKFGEKLPMTSFQTIGLGTVGRMISSKGVYEEVTGGSYVQVKPPEGVLVANIKVAVPRKVSSLPTASSVYQRIADDFNRSKGLPVPAILTKVVSVDLDGDGSKEVLIEARNFKTAYEPLEDTTGRTTYSWVLLRHLTKSGVKQSPLEFYSSKQKGWTPPLKMLRAIADLNGDGRMELVTSGDYHEGQGAALWSFNRGKVTILVRLEAGV